MRELAIGLVLILGSIGSVFALAPRGGRQSWFVGVPFIEPFAAIIIVALLMLGILFVAAQFSTIDDVTMLKGVR
jgi:hypothetical protein